MKCRENDIYQIIDLYNYFLSSEFSFDIEIEVLCDSYQIEDIKYHKWKIRPLHINCSVFTQIRLSDYILDEILCLMQTVSISQVLKLYYDIIKESMQ